MPTAGLSTTWLGPGDAEACAVLDRQALGGLWSADQWKGELQGPGHRVIGLRDGDTLLGLASGQVILDEFHLTAVAVHPAWRRRGLAQRLLETLLQDARARGCQRATLEVDSRNVAALALYGRLGFRTEGIRRAYYRSGGDALIQWADL